MCGRTFSLARRAILRLPIVEGDEDAGTQRERRRDVQNIQGPREGAGAIFCGPQRIPASVEVDEFLHVKEDVREVGP